RWRRIDQMAQELDCCNQKTANYDTQQHGQYASSHSAQPAKRPSSLKYIRVSSAAGKPVKRGGPFPSLFSRKLTFGNAYAVIQPPALIAVAGPVPKKVESLEPNLERRTAVRISSQSSLDQVERL